METELLFQWLWTRLALRIPVEKQALFKQILRSTWDNQSYLEMSQTLNYADSYVQKSLARELWEIASHELGEPVSKKTIKFKAAEFYKRAGRQELSDNRPHDTPLNDLPTHLRRTLPFGDVGKITQDERFFDRESTLSEIYGHLSDGSSISLIGEREIGKSSILAKLCRRGPEKLGLPAQNFVYLDMQLIHDESMFFTELCKALNIAVSRGYDLLDQLAAQRYILCIDEAEKLSSPQFSVNLREELRGFADGWDMPFSLVIASATPLCELFPDESYQTSPLANLCAPIWVKGFSPALCRQFLRDRLRQSPIHFTPQQVETLIETSQGHPARLQNLARLLYLDLEQKKTP